MNLAKRDIVAILILILNFELAVVIASTVESVYSHPGLAPTLQQSTTASITSISAAPVYGPVPRN